MASQFISVAPLSMEAQLRPPRFQHSIINHRLQTAPSTMMFPSSASSLQSRSFPGYSISAPTTLLHGIEITGRRRRGIGIVASSDAAAPPLWDGWKPEKGLPPPSLSDVVWPSAGAFAAMAILGRIDAELAPQGIAMSIAPFGAVSAVLFAAPSSPAARKYNVFVAQIGCAAIGVLAFSLFGPGWLARSAALAASIAFMIYTRSTHPPAASLPLLFIDGAKFHVLNLWYALFPGAVGCILLCLIQATVCYLRDNCKF